MKLQGKVAIVTGAGSGIGRATAQLFGREGASTVIAERSIEAGEATAKLIRDEGGTALLVPTDVSRRTEVQAMVARTVSHFGRLDILVNNAGIGGVSKRFLELSEEEWDEVLDINLKGHFLCALYAAQAMALHGGAIVNTSSPLAQLALLNCTPYCASKAGIIGLTKSLALELARSRIRVNCIIPGSTDTPLMWDGLSDEERREVEPQVAEAEPLGRIGDPMEIARTTLFLVSDDASFVTGAVYAVDGGLLAKLATVR